MVDIGYFDPSWGCNPPVEFDASDVAAAIAEKAVEILGSPDLLAETVSDSLFDSHFEAKYNRCLSALARAERKLDRYRAADALVELLRLSVKERAEDSFK